MGPLTPALIGGGLQILGGLMGRNAAKKREEAAANERRMLKSKLNYLENNRQEIINPYEGIADLSGMISNPFANLSVATNAAEMQIEQADISLANTLDTIRATGSGAGGATALAQAALKSKQGVSANIEQQEKNNEDKRAQGEQQMEQRQMAEAQRLQQADVAGEQFMFSTREDRQMQELDRASAMLGAARQAEGQAQSDATGAITSAIGGISQIIGGYGASNS